MLVLGLLFVLVLVVITYFCPQKIYVNEIHGGILYKNDCLVSSKSIVVRDSLIESFLIPSGITGQQLISANGKFNLIMKSDGNLTVYNDSGTSIWQSNTSGSGTTPYRAIMESTGNFVVYDSKNAKIWETGTSTANSSLLLDSTGMFKILNSSSKVLWVSDCTKVTQGPFTSECLKKWWADKGCTADITKTTNYSTWLANTGTSTAMQTSFNTLATTKDNVSCFLCYGVSAFQKYKMSKLESGVSLSSVSSVYTNGDRLWSPDETSYYLTFTSDGDLVVKNSSGTTTWSAGASDGSSPYSLKIVNGNLLLNNTYGSTYWSIMEGTAIYLTIDNNGVLRLYNSSSVVWISDCSKLTNGPFTENCMKQWWMDKGCTTDTTKYTNYYSWKSDTGTGTAMQNKINTLATTQDESSSQACYGLALFDKYKLSSLQKEQKLSSNVSSGAYWNPNGQRLWSPDGSSYYMVMQKDGNLVVYNKNGTALNYQSNEGTNIWQSNTANKGSAPYKAQLDTDGDFVIYDSANTKIWRTYTNLTNTVPILSLDNTGGLTLISQNRSNAIQWMSKFDSNKLSKLESGEVLSPSQSLWSPDGTSYKLSLLTNGNLVLYDNSSNITWQTNTATTGTVVYKLKLATNGILTLWDNANSGKWSPTGVVSVPGGTNVSLTLDNNGQLKLSDPNNNVKWVSDCSKLTIGPFSPGCLQTWWGNKKCTSYVTKQTDYSTWLANTGSSTDMQTRFNTIATTQDETSSQSCYEISVYEKYKLSTLTSGAAISSTSTNSNKLWSPNGSSYNLKPQNDGNLVLYNSSGTSIWSSGTSGTSPPYTLTMRVDGNLVFTDSSGIAKWSSGTSGTGVTLTVSDTGQLKLSDPSNNVKWVSDCTKLTTGPFSPGCLSNWWSDKGCTTDITANTSYSTWLSNTGTSTDMQTSFNTLATTQDETSSQQCYGISMYEKYKFSTLSSGAVISSTSTNSNKLWSPDGSSYYLVPKNDGSLILYNSSGTSIWSSGTSGTNPPYKLYMQTDGNLVLYDKSNTAKWSSGTTGSGVKLVLTNDGIFYLVDSSNKLKWISKERRLSSVKNSGYSIDNNGNTINNGNAITLWENNDSTAQKWVYNPDKTIRSKTNTDYCIDIPGGTLPAANTSGTNIKLWQCNGSTAQKFEYDTVNKTFAVDKNKNFCLDINGGTISNGSNIQIYTCNSSNAQQFNLI